MTQNTSTATLRIQAFVAQFNSMVDLLDGYTAVASSSNAGGVLAGDTSILELAHQLRAIVAQTAVVSDDAEHHTLRDIGVSTTDNHLLLDSNKLNAVLQTDPQAVSELLSGPCAITAGGTTTSLIPGMSMVAQRPLPGLATTATINYAVAARGILQILNEYITQSRGPNGIFTAESTNATSTLHELTAQIANQNTLLVEREAALLAEFTAMQVALASLQSQSGALTSSLASLSSSASCVSNG